MSPTQPPSNKLLLTSMDNEDADTEDASRADFIGDDRRIIDNGRELSIVDYYDSHEQTDVTIRNERKPGLPPVKRQGANDPEKSLPSGLVPALLWEDPSKFRYPDPLSTALSKALLCTAGQDGLTSGHEFTPDLYSRLWEYEFASYSATTAFPPGFDLNGAQTIHDMEHLSVKLEKTHAKAIVIGTPSACGPALIGGELSTATAKRPPSRHLSAKRSTAKRSPAKHIVTAPNSIMNATRMPSRAQAPSTAQPVQWAENMTPESAKSKWQRCEPGGPPSQPTASTTAAAAATTVTGELNEEYLPAIIETMPNVHTPSTSASRQTLQPTYFAEQYSPDDRSDKRRNNILKQLKMAKAKQS
ncbi:hypothetical protein BGZ54_000499 [Gamsiella multidivaricata]|nr:hypothetical protein BGZ54_000499 [Gamsiella multidivaricata]